ncbi:MAG: capsular biosynthesis protein [Sedimenticolaceae bacterium]
MPEAHRNDIEKKVFLFLQGPPNFFARHLADELQRRGHRALRINLCTGDFIYWLGRPATNYRHRLDHWEAFLRAYVAREGVTHILYYADRLPYHRIAIKTADDLGLIAISYEFGYLRPDWITLERRGMSAQSHFPDDPARIRQIACQVPEPDLTARYRFPFHKEALHEVTFNLSNFFLFFLYPFYDADKVYNRMLEYLSYIPRLLNGSRAARHANATIERLIADGSPFFVFPLQMQNDYQVRANSPYRHLSEVIGETLRSFAAHAPPDTQLVFKVHPLDNGLEHWPSVLSRLAAENGISTRVTLIDGGDLMTLLRHARGVVLINSTVGIHALQADCPVKVMGIATYDITGLTHQESLDSYWRAPTKPDPDLRDDLIRALAASIQVKGNFYTKEGQARAIPEIADRLIDGRVNEPDAFVDPPPRLARAAALGVPGLGNNIDPLS